MREIPLGKDAMLKLLTVEDAVDLSRLIDNSRSYLREWLPWVDASRTIENTIGFITSTLEQKERNQGLHFGIWYKGRLTGTLGVHKIDWLHRKTEIGYWLGAEYQGKGLMTASVRAYLNELVFGEWDLNKVSILAARENRKSRAIPERLGFKQDGILRQNECLYGRFVDHVVYSMLASEWEQSNAKILD
ncbi:MAG: GNAT family N-acetyltransferase [Clostridia bacterium]